MTISGFSFVKNATKLYYPIRAVIESILPIVDEFVVAVGDNDPDDHTLQEIEAIGSPKVKILHTTWNLEAFPNGTENAHQTDLAKAACSGDWLFYLQADEVVHEKYLPTIAGRCRELLPDKRIEGLVFDYVHFWGDYHHYQHAHGWYPYEVRIIRNDPEIHSWQSAQSFRRIPQFNGKNYRQEEGTHKLNVAHAHAAIYHYGWVRPPRLMQNKRRALDTVHKGSARVAELYKGQAPLFDYGPLGRLPRFRGTHPAVMQAFIERFDWQEQLRYDKGPFPQRDRPFKHEIWKNRALTWFEQNLFGGRQLFTFRNYNLLKV
mgnify:CR=1 FL=1